MPTTPLEFRNRSGPKNPLSHERILKVCYAYRTLHNAFLATGGTITSELYATMLDIDREIISWEQRSARLHYAARRQSEAREAMRLRGGTKLRDAKRLATLQDIASAETKELDPDEPPPHVAGQDDFGFNESDESESNIIPDATKETLARYKADRGIATLPPDNANFKKSGLV